jgi:hypothetical protein
MLSLSDDLQPVPYMVHVWRLEAWRALFWVPLAQVLANANPVLHLRLARYRLDRLASRRQTPRGGSA